MIHEFSETLHLFAKNDGTPPSQLYGAGLSDFVKLDSHALGSPRAICRAALDLAVTTRGDWEPCWRTVIGAIIAFMIEKCDTEPAVAAKAKVQAMASQKASLPMLENWFDEAFPA